MPDRVVQRTKIAEMLAVVAVLVALTTSLAAYTVNKHSISRINDSRISLTYNACLDSNQRNTNTKNYLVKLTDEAIKKNPEREAVIRNNLAQTEVLIDALAPKQNCRKLVFERFGHVPTPETPVRTTR